MPSQGMKKLVKQQKLSTCLYKFNVDIAFYILCALGISLVSSIFDNSWSTSQTYEVV